MELRGLHFLSQEDAAVSGEAAVSLRELRFLAGYSHLHGRLHWTGSTSSVTIESNRA